MRRISAGVDQNGGVRSGRRCRTFVARVLSPSLWSRGGAGRRGRFRRGGGHAMDIAVWLAVLVGFFVRLEARFSAPTRAISTAARAGAVKDARLRARKGLSLTAPSTLPG